MIALFLALFSAYLYLKKTASFRFFDEENNIVAGYFMTQGRALYKDIFMNHNPLPLVISQILQSIFRSDTLFELVKLHRVYMIVFGLAANTLLLIRFRTKALLFVGVYEFLRFYISGQMFLAEGMIAYMFAYYVFLLSEKYYQDKDSHVSTAELIISSVLFVFISLSREPYVPLVAILYALVLIKCKAKIHVIFAILLSGLSIFLFMLQYDLGEFYKQVFILNKQFAYEESKSQGGLQIFSGITQLYQYVFAAIDLNKPLYIVLGIINIAFIFLTTKIVLARKGVFHKIFICAVFVSLLFISGMRNFSAGVEWYGMYRSIPYIVIILAFVSSSISHKLNLVLLTIVLVLAFTHPRSHFIERRVNADEYYINYSTTTTDGVVLESLCKNIVGCTLHIDDIYVYPYIVSKIKPSSGYALYYPVQRAFLDFKSIRETDLLQNPPTLYYDGSCHISRIGLPYRIQNEYIWLIKDDGKKVEKSCIAFNRSIADKITNDKKEFIKKHFYKLPELVH